MQKNSNGEWIVTGETLLPSERRREKDTAGIYGLRNKTTGKWYIGQSWNIKSRLRSYKSSKCVCQPKIFRAIRKYGYEDFEVFTLETMPCPSQIALNRIEDKWINIHDSIKNGYNTREAGSRGRHSLETKKLMREKGLHRKHSEKSIQLMREIKRRDRKVGKEHPNYGKRHNESVIEKIKSARAIQKHSLESNLKRSEAAKRLWATRRENGTLKDVCSKITEGKLKGWAERKRTLTSS